MNKTDNKQNSGNRRIAWAFFLNVSFTIIEFIGGWLTNSTAIMADAVHDLGDSLSIGSAWLLSWISGREANKVFTYGFRRLSLLGALINGMVLIGGSFWVLLQAVPRLTSPVLPEAGGMIALAVLGIAVNGYAAYRLSDGETLNERVLNWHLLEDVLGWVAVLVVGITLMFIDLPILDPILAIGFTLFVLFNVTKNTLEAVKLFVQAAPDAGMIETIRQRLTKLDEVSSIHHEHAWSLDGESHVYTAHLRLKTALDANQHIKLKREVAAILGNYSFAHTTIEFEYGDEECRDEN